MKLYIILDIHFCYRTIRILLISLLLFSSIIYYYPIDLSIFYELGIILINRIAFTNLNQSNHNIIIKSRILMKRR